MTTGWRFEPDAVRAAYADCARGLAGVAARIPGDAWDRPGLGVWTVRDLVGHAGRALTVTEAYLDAADAADRAASTDDPQILSHPIDYYRAIAAGSHADHAAVAERGRRAGRELGADPAGTVDALATRVVERIASEDDAAPVATPFGTMRLIDYLPSRVFELTVHRLDAVEAAGIADVDGRPGVALSLVVAAGVAGLRSDAFATLLAITGRRGFPKGFSVI
ncbi:MAG: maleylpyruvate isomerase N-terminal domain-containing protein [Acidimicrobiales bacterium]